MSNALVQISGTVTNTTIWTPQNCQKGKPVLKIDISKSNRYRVIFHSKTTKPMISKLKEVSGRLDLN